MAELYNLLQDKLSKKLFEARLAYDLEQSPENMLHIVSLGGRWKLLDELAEKNSAYACTVKQNHKKLVLYGTNISGHVVATLFLKKHIDFYGFCGRRAKEFPDGLMGKPVISPDDLFRNPDEFYVILTVTTCRDEIVSILKENGFPQDHILASLPPELDREPDCQYFDFPSLYPRGTAFVDGGCYDCRNSFHFADWCGGGVHQNICL